MSDSLRPHGLYSPWNSPGQSTGVGSLSLIREAPLHIFSSVQSLSRVQLFATPWTATRQASLSITNSWSLFKLMSVELVMQSLQMLNKHKQEIQGSVAYMAEEGG